MTSELEVYYEYGRVPNLSPDEQQKLKDMWSHFLAYCGVLPESLNRAPSALTIHSAGSSEKPASKSKSRWGFFRSKDPEPESLTGEGNEAAAFKEAIKNLPGEEVLNSAFSMCRFDSADSLLLRFLRARKWDVGNALVMMGHTLYWRIKEGKPDEILFKGEAGAIKEGNDGLMLQLRAKKAWIYGNDNEGRPVVHVHPHRHDPKAQDITAVQDFTIFLIENARLCLKEPVDTACVLFDLSKFSLSNMDYGAVKFIIACFEGYYPESLGRLVIHKPPWIFTSIWNIIKAWMDPVVVNKVIFTRNREELLKYFDDSVIEKEHGGTCAFEYEYIEPTPEESIKISDVSTREKLVAQRQELYDEYIQTTIEWIKSADKTTNEQTREKRNKIAQQLAELYWNSDDYLRARSIIDRNGVLDYFQQLHKNWKVVEKK